jgi:hypothetical protein
MSVKPNGDQKLIKQPVQLITKSPTAALYDLFIESVGVQGDRPFPVDIEVFKRHLQQMFALQKFKGLDIRPYARRFDSDP